MEVFDMLPVMNRNLWMPEEFNDFFDTDFMPRVSATAPAINVKESEKDYTVELAAPGLTKDDFNVNIDNDGNLHIKIENKSNSVTFSVKWTAKISTFFEIASGWEEKA